MTKSKRRPKAVKGALLIMVLTVMFVLIFLLAGTIAVVYSSHNRVINKYEESQAYYTARSVLDSYIETFLKDNKNVSGANGTTTVNYYYIDTSGATPSIQHAVSKQGRAMEMDLYKLAVDMDKSTKPEVGCEREPSDDRNFPDWAKQAICGRCLSLDAIDSAAFTNAGITSYTDYSDGLEQLRAHCESDSTLRYDYWRQVVVDSANPNEDSFKHNVNSNYGDASTHTVDDTVDAQLYSGFGDFYNQFKAATAAASANTMYYVVPARTFESYGSSTTYYGKVVDTVQQRYDYNGFGSDYPDAVLKVEMLERSYHIDPLSDSDFKYMFDAGTRKKDYIKIKVTSTVYYDGQPTTTSIIYRTEYSPQPANDQALTSLGGLGVSRSQFSADGGMSSLDPNGCIDLNTSGMTGSLYCENDAALTAAGGDIVFADDAHWVIKHDFSPENQRQMDAISDGGFIYIGNELKHTAAGLKINTHNKDFSWIVNKFRVQQNPSDTKIGKVYCNLYEMKENNNNKTDGCWTNDLYLSAGVSITQSGSTYTITTDNLGGVTGDIKVCKHVILPAAADAGSTVTVMSSDADTVRAATYGNYSSDTIVVDASKCTFVNTAATPSFNISYLNSEVKLDYNVASDYGGALNADCKKVFTMPDGSSFEVDTAQSRYGQYYEADAFLEESASAGHGGDLSDTLANLVSKQITAESKAAAVGANAGTCEVTTSNVLASNTLAGDITTGKYIWRSNIDVNNGVNWVVDTSSGDVVIQLEKVTSGTGVFGGKVLVKGTGKLTILIPAGGEYDLGGTTDGTALQILYESTENDIRAAGTNPTVKTGSASPLTTPPEIDILAASGSNVKVQGSKTLIHGYVYGPDCNLSLQSQVNGDWYGQYNFRYDNGTVSPAVSRRVWLVGSAVIGSYAGENSGVAYIGRNTDTSTPGDRLLGWADVYYMRGE